jgi:chemosensory pili system protein ChpA (sensor histidine kinase/response regulator)
MQILEIPEQTPSSEIDEEIIEIFVEEVQEVQAEIVSFLNAWKTDPEDTESLKNLRRSFHTLKGSGRLVGATIIGELGWRIEHMLNRIIEGTLAVTNEMFSLIEQAQSVLPNLLELFQNNEKAPDDIILLISQVAHLTERKAQESSHFNAITETPEVQASSTPTVQLEPSEEPVVPPEIENSADEFETGDIQNESSELLNQETLHFESEMPDESLDLGPLNLDDSELELGLEGFPENELGEWGEDFSDSHLELETLNTPDIDGLNEELDTDSLLPSSELKMGDETTLEGTEDLSFQYETVSLGEPTLESAFDSSEEEIDPILIEIFTEEASQHLENLHNILTDLEKNLPAQLEQEIVRAFHTLNGSSRSVDLTIISKIAAPMEDYARALLERKIPLSSEMLGYLHNATRIIEKLLSGEKVDEAQQESLLDNVHQSLISLQDIPPQKTEPDLSSSSAQEAEPEPATPVVATPPSETSSEPVPDATDEFIVIFLDEAEEILENTQSLLERWHAAPNNMPLMKELQRELHTLKGGSRMVGIAAMGDLSHHLESVLTKIVEGTAQSNTKLQEIVQNSVDELAAMLEAVRSGVPLEMPVDLIGQINIALNPDAQDSQAFTPDLGKKHESTTTPSPPTPKTEEAKAKPEKSLEKETELAESTEDKIRVRVVLIDKLTNLAGEMSISRAQMEQQQGAFKNNLVEMEQTVIRLRDQLRRLEIETEAQILSHFSGQKELVGNDNQDEEFDLLELDRFSVMQQLSRSLMESVSDLLNIQDYLKTQTRQGDSLLIQQSRIGAELQEGIMRTRMIPFSTISPRLQRIARLTARELHKQVEFLVIGETIEFERSVLNRVIAPLEHLLRNAIGHGIEDAQTRQQAGKSSVAKIILELSREGAELVIKLSDDGSGLNLQAIRQKAEERGLIQPDTVVNDHELMHFILEPGFSTAKVLTQVSGRGVGMDVVNTEIKQLGGGLRIHSKAGEGSLFEIRLPLSLTINHALLMQVGEETIAIPMNHLDAVMRIPREQVIGEENEVRHYQYMDNSYRVFHLGELLGFSKAASVEASLIPTLLVRAANRRVALLVDRIEGSKEIVVKPVGPQIGAIRWIAGATILGDGRVVLILDVPTLTRVDTPIQIEQPKVVEESVEEKSVAKTIMVVDDSITVRKVTARLLKRQGLEVLTAKDGLDAITQLQEHIPDLMLLDVEMPRMDGYELATNVRNNPDLKHIPIIMITSRTGAKHRDKAEKIGINRYLGKPFNETELLENIRALLDE